jgi:hypothetical protein
VIVVDTNVLVYAADADSPHHLPCRRWLEARRGRAEAWYCTWPIVYEFLRVSTHPRVLRNPWKSTEAWAFVAALLASPGLSMLIPTLRHADVAAELLRELPHLSGNILHDAHTAVLMREHGIRQICTRDTDFHRFPFLSVLDPLAV